MEIFEELKKAREEKKLTFEHIHHHTKIAIPFLQAIENGDLDKLPPHLASSYIRTYAQFMQVSPDPLLEALRTSKSEKSPQAGEPNSTTYISRSKKQKNNKKPIWKNKSVLTIGISLCSLIVLGCLSWLLYNLFFAEENHAETQNNQNTVNQQQIEEDLQSFQLPTAKDRAQLQLIEPKEANEKADKYRVSNTETIQLSVVAKKSTQIKVMHGDQEGKVINKTLQPNEEQSFQDSQSLSIEVSNPHAVKLSVNGITIDTSEQTDQARYQFELEDKESQ